MCLLGRHLHALPPQPQPVSTMRHSLAFLPFSRQSAGHVRESELVSIRVDSTAGLLGYLFSSSGPSKKTGGEQYEDVVLAVNSYLDLTTSMPPSDVLVLNQGQVQKPTKRQQRVLSPTE
jgi:hypothetical protein